MISCDSLLRQKRHTMQIPSKGNLELFERQRRQRIGKVSTTLFSICVVACLSALLLRRRDAFYYSFSRLLQKIVQIPFTSNQIKCIFPAEEKLEGMQRTDTISVPSSNAREKISRTFWAFGQCSLLTDAMPKPSKQSKKGEERKPIILGMILHNVVQVRRARPIEGSLGYILALGWLFL